MLAQAVPDASSPARCPTSRQRGRREPGPPPSQRDLSTPGLSQCQRPPGTASSPFHAACTGTSCHPSPAPSPVCVCREPQKCCSAGAGSRDGAVGAPRSQPALATHLHPVPAALARGRGRGNGQLSTGSQDPPGRDAQHRPGAEGGDTPSPPPCYRGSGPSQARTPQTSTRASLPRARSSTAVPRCCPIPPPAPRLRPSSASSPAAAAGTAARSPLAGSAPSPLRREGTRPQPTLMSGFGRG